MKVKEEDLDETFTYISDGTWFIKDTEVKLECNCGMSGLFRGRRIADGKHEIKMYGTNERIDGELCCWEEFKITKNGETIELL